MARKIPLERTIGGAYSFLFTNFISVLGIAWLPILLFGGLIGATIWYGAIQHPLPPLHLVPGHPDIAFFAAAGRVVLPGLVFAILLSVMLITGLTRRALGKLEGTTFIYFNLGAPFWRMLASLLLAIILLIVLRLAMQAVAFVWNHFVGHFLPPGILVIVDILGVLTLAFIYLYVLARLIFLLPAVVMAEDRIGIARAWSLSAGSFWRIVLVVIAAFLPAAIVFGIVWSVLFSGAFAGLPMPPFAGEANPAPKEVMDYVQKMIPLAADHLRFTWPLIAIAAVLYSLVRDSLFAGATVSAYRGLTANDGA